MAAGTTTGASRRPTGTDAPVLGDRSLARALKGRAYDLYYNGPHLHMVVIRRGKARPTGSSTRLLDELSNETMLAIAKGLAAASTSVEVEFRAAMSQTIAVFGAGYVASSPAPASPSSATTWSSAT